MITEFFNERDKLLDEIKEYYKTLPPITLKEDSPEVAEKRKELSSLRYKLKTLVENYMKEKPKPTIVFEPTFNVDAYHLEKGYQLQKINREDGTLIHKMDAVLISIHPTKLTFAFYRRNNGHATEQEIWASWVASGEWNIAPLAPVEN